MSYCRWSSDGYQCDVYVYEDVYGGWRTHVATRRPKTPAPVLSDSDVGSIREWIDAQGRWSRAQDALPDEERWVDFSHLPSAGESFNDPTPGDCADRLEALRAGGFNVPQYAIDELREEQAGGAS